MAAAVRIYADFHGLMWSPKGKTGVVLDTFGSLRDLANAGIVLREGLPLIAVDASDESEDLEGHGTAQYDPENKWWILELDEQGVRYVPAGDRTPVMEFNCVACKAPLHDLINANGLKNGDACPSCGISIHAPIAPPKSAT